MFSLFTRDMAQCLSPKYNSDFYFKSLKSFFVFLSVKNQPIKDEISNYGALNENNRI